MAQAQVGTEKKTGWLTVLIIIGILFAGVQTAGLFLWRGYNQNQLKEQGELAHARIISVTQTNVTINESRVYKIEAELRLPNREPFNATVEQSFSASEVSRIHPESWVEIRYDPESSSEFVITGRAIAAPSQEPNPPVDLGVVELAAPAEPEPQTAPVKPANGTDRLGCAQARACCRIVSPDNVGCDSYLNPHIPDESCRIALGAYVKAAAALGKSCQGF